VIRNIKFKPGLQLDNTPDAAVGGFINAQWYRFRGLGGEDLPLPEIMPGYEIFSATPLDGPARGMHAWLDRSGQPLLAKATPTNVYATVGGAQRVITPFWGEFFLTDPISTENGSTTVTVKFNVYDPDSNTSVEAPHGLIPGDSVILSHVDAIGGITPNGTYSIVTVPTLTTFTITHGSPASSTATMSGASKVWLRVAFRPGLTHGTGGTGYGTGTYSTGPYGLPSVGDYEPRVTTFGNLSDRLYFVPRSGPLFGYQPRDTYPEQFINGDFAASAGIALGTGWTISGGKLVATAGTGSNASQNVVGRAEPGAVYRVIVNPTTVTAGSFYIGANAGSPAAVVRLSPDISKTGTWEFDLQMPADPLDIVIAKSATFAGEIESISVKIKSTAYRIPEAPIASDSMCVDQRGIIHLFATYQVDGTFNASCSRCSGVNNERQWVPDTDNVASEFVFTIGGRVIAGRASRSSVVVWTDGALYSGPYTATPGEAYKFDHAGGSAGLIAPLAHAEHEGFVFWMTPQGRYRSVAYDFQGTKPVTIECSGENTFFASLAPSQAGKIFAWTNVENGEIWFHIPAGSGDTSEIEVNRAAIFSTKNLTWSFTNIDRTSAVKSGEFDFPIMAAPDGYLYFHEKGFTANGSPIESWIETAPIMIEDGETFMDFDRFVCDFKDQQGPISFILSGKGFPREPGFTRPAQTITPTTAVIDDLVTARRLWFKFYANASPTAGRFGGIQLDANPTDIEE
jgi:hypothetical protein